MKKLLLAAITAIGALTMVVAATGPSLAHDGRDHRGYRQGYHAPVPFLAYQFKHRHAHRYGYRHGHRHYRPSRWHRPRGHRRGWRHGRPGWRYPEYRRDDRRDRAEGRGDGRRDRRGERRHRG